MPKKQATAVNLFFDIDPAYKALDGKPSPLVQDVWQDKYRWEDEDWAGMCKRVVEAVYAKDDPDSHFSRVWVANTIDAMNNRLWMPAGRILAGAGTPKRVTLLNCFVNSTIEDDMEAIARGLGNIMLTMQQGGGIGTDFSQLRPPGAILRRTGAVASGPGPFIDTWDSACTTIRSAGDRRGAMMGTLICTHPFLPEFIKAKHAKGRWTNFNVSVLVTDAFMGAVQDDEDWYLHHPVEPAFERPEELKALDFRDNDDVHQYVYSVHKARDLWDQIIKSTYDYAEPGVIFIDRVNDMNNLGYVEEIMCTNPCGEQPLPPHGCCDLGAVNITRMVKDPFTPDAEFDWAMLREVTRLGVRFLDNVIDVTNYPLPEQREEEFNKRRIGVGVSGLADAMHFLGMRYGSPRSIRFAEEVMREICYASYRESIELAREKGAFPLFDKEEYLARPFINQLPEDIRDGIAAHGIRNGVLLTIAPTGTTSIAFGNNSSGLEPVFAHSYRRRVRQGDDTWEEYDEMAYGARLYRHLNPGVDLPGYMNECADVKIHEHVRIQEVCQKWVDASISKTINVPKEISFEEFRDVYQLAYESGCKGCTTYRPSDTRGSVLEVVGEQEKEDAPAGDDVRTVYAPEPSLAEVQRPELLTSQTMKIHWPNLQSALYLTIGYVNNQPYEVFLNSKDQKSLEWTMAVTLLMSMSLRRGIELETLADEFQQIHALEGGWAPNGDGKSQYWPSLLAYLGYKMKQMTRAPGAWPPLWVSDFGVPADAVQATKVEVVPDSQPIKNGSPISGNQKRGKQCPQCQQFTVINLSGCDTCSNCGHSKCG